MSIEKNGMETENLQKKPPNPHAHHRQRMLDRAMEHGLDNFADHELLELLLFYALPRVNTNPTAHALLDRFGTVKDALSATVEELCTVDGVGMRSALLLKTVLELMKRYERDVFETPKTYRTLVQIARYLHPYFVGVNVERLYMVLFNHRMNIVDCVLISEGTTGATDISLAKISKAIFQKNAAAVLLAHNHPNGLTLPSAEDIQMNDEVKLLLDRLGIVHLEHLIFVDYHYRPIMREDHGLYRISPISQKKDVGFYQKLYAELGEEGCVPQLLAEE